MTNIALHSSSACSPACSIFTCIMCVASIAQLRSGKQVQLPWAQYLALISKRVRSRIKAVALFFHFQLTPFSELSKLTGLIVFHFSNTQCHCTCSSWPKKTQCTMCTHSVHMASRQWKQELERICHGFLLTAPRELMD